MKTTVAICQFDMSRCDIETNLANIGRMVERCRADVVVLPEMFATGFVTDTVAFAQDMEGEIVEWMKRTAFASDCAIVGSAIISDGGRYFNRMLFVKPSGEVVCYDKHHLFSIGGEARLLTAGIERVVAEFRGVRYLLQVCYDLRFPVWSRYRGDYDVAIYSASWAASRGCAWRTLLRARAVENQAYVVGVNRVGTDATDSYAGGSVVVGYKGETLLDAGDCETVAAAILDTGALDGFRRDFPVWRDADEFTIKV